MCDDMRGGSGAAAAEDVRAAFIELCRAVDRARAMGVTVKISAIPEGALDRLVMREGSVVIERLEYPKMVRLHV